MHRCLRLHRHIQHQSSHTITASTPRLQFQFRCRGTGGASKSKKDFVDKIHYLCDGGRGGDGVISFRRERALEFGGPDGGDGGQGGHIVIRAKTYTISGTSGAQELNTSLPRLGYHQRAGSGGNGMGRLRKGKNGENRVIEVPVGTIVRDMDLTGGTSIVAGSTSGVLADLSSDGDEIVVCRGGFGGRGNRHFATSTDRAPRVATKGSAGERKLIQLELKSIADVGLVGYPNAGKSTFLGAVSKAKPKVAAYPFTTMHPTVGEVVMDDFFTLTIADIPGLIEGAHANMGLGYDFLRHVERTKVLMYVLDISGLQGIGIIPMEDGTWKYDFLDPETSPRPDLEENTPYRESEQETRALIRELEMLRRRGQVSDEARIVGQEGCEQQQQQQQQQIESATAAAVDDSDTIGSTLMFDYFENDDDGDGDADDVYGGDYVDIEKMETVNKQRLKGGRRRARPQMRRQRYSADHEDDAHDNDREELHEEYTEEQSQQRRRTRDSRRMRKLLGDRLTSYDPVMSSSRIESNNNFSVQPTPTSGQFSYEQEAYIGYEEEDEIMLQHRITRRDVKDRKDQMYLLQPWEVLRKLENELERYIPGLSSRAKLIIANKIDIPGARENLEILKQHTDLPIFPVCALEGENLQPVLQYLKKLLLEDELQRHREQQHNKERLLKDMK